MANDSQASEQRGYTIQSASNSADTITKLTVLRGRTLFRITADHALLEGTQFYKEYEQLNMRVHEQVRQLLATRARISEPWVEPHNFICERLLPLFCRLSPNPEPEPSPQGFTLQDLIATPTYNLNLIAAEPTSKDDILIKGEENGITYTPSYGISPAPTQDLPESCEGIAHVDASKVSIEQKLKVRGLGSIGTRGAKVLLADGTRRLFKARTLLKKAHERRELDFDRELDILARINKNGLRGEVRLPNLVGIVVSGDMTIGMLQELIPTSVRGDSVMDKGFWEDPILCQKWKEQVTRSVELLHANNIVWGSINPGTVVIDEMLDAWVTDFSGGNNRHFIEDKLRETVEGDWQGVKRLFEEWLPSRRVDVHESIGAF